MTKRRLQLASIAAIVFGLVAASIALASGGNGKHGRKHEDGRFRAHLIGFQEVPAVNTTGHGKLRFEMTNSEITFRLDYADLSGPPLVAHIHVGQRSVNGGVSVFFCGGGGKPPCPNSASGTVTGTITAADVLGPVSQGFDPGDLAALERAIKAGVTYANMHTMKFPGGEIRGQIKGGHGHGGDK
jgi:CHRD domain-containing protein